MKINAKIRLSRILASVCFGSACFSATLFGQQLTPVVKDKLSSQTESVANKDQDLAPIVTAAELIIRSDKKNNIEPSKPQQRPNDTLPPIVRAAEIRPKQIVPESQHQPAIVVAQRFEGTTSDPITKTQSKTQSKTIAPASQQMAPIVTAQRLNSTNADPTMQIQAKAIGSVSQQPPIVTAQPVVRNAPADTTDIHPKTAEQALPPIVSAQRIQTKIQQQKTAVAATPTIGEHRSKFEQPPKFEQSAPGANFPPDAQKRIAEFIRANEPILSATEDKLSNEKVAEIKPTTFSLPPKTTPPQSQIGQPPRGSALLDSKTTQKSNLSKSQFAQGSALSDSPIQPVPVPSIKPGITPIINDVAAPVMMSQPPPSIGGSAFLSAPQPAPVQTQFPQQPPVQGFPQPTFQDPMAYPGGAYGTVGQPFQDYGFSQGARGYFVFDALFWDRPAGTFRASNITVINEHDWTKGGRVTIGRRRDAVIGWEASFMGFDPWIETSTQYNPPATLFGAIFPDASGFPDASYSSFRSATFMEQFHKTDLNSVEVNKTWWGADVAKVFIGGRFVYFQDKFHLSSANAFGEQGIYKLRGTNNLAGVHAGSQAIYDIGRRAAFSVGGKLGVYANFARGEVQLINSSSLVHFRQTDNTDFSATMDLSATLHMRLGNQARFRIGYDAFVITSAVTAEQNYTTIVSPASVVVFNESVVLHGLAIGFEIYR